MAMKKQMKKCWTASMAIGLAMSSYNVAYLPKRSDTTYATKVQLSSAKVTPQPSPTSIANCVDVYKSQPTIIPTVAPTLVPTMAPTLEPTLTPTIEPTPEPTLTPTVAPTPEPTVAPTEAPKSDKYDFDSKFFQDFDKEERFCLYRIVEAEVTDQEYICKKNVAAVIINRVRDTSGEFPNTIHDVVYQKKQFAPISDGRFWKVTITEETKKACIEAYNEGYTAQGALYFANIQDVKVLRTKEWFKSLNYLFGDSSGHSFYN